MLYLSQEKGKEIKKMKVYIVVGNKEVYGVYTDIEKAEAVAREENKWNEYGGGYGNIATVVEKEIISSKQKKNTKRRA